VKEGAKTGILILAVVVAAAVESGGPHDSTGVGMPDDHFELHKQLKLSEAQEREMEALEEGFREKLAELSEPIHEANGELATALVEDRTHSPRVKAAIEKIHHAQAALQNATIDHIIEMRTILDEHQFTEFLEATADSLRPTGNNH
jgi:Spy/CpxP family protein refolding chaperone